MSARCDAFVEAMGGRAGDHWRRFADPNVRIKNLAIFPKALRPANGSLIRFFGNFCDKVY